MKKSIVLVSILAFLLTVVPANAQWGYGGNWRVRQWQYGMYGAIDDALYGSVYNRYHRPVYVVDQQHGMVAVPCDCPKVSTAKRIFQTALAAGIGAGVGYGITGNRNGAIRGAAIGGTLNGVKILYDSYRNQCFQMVPAVSLQGQEQEVRQPINVVVGSQPEPMPVPVPVIEAPRQESRPVSIALPAYRDGSNSLPEQPVEWILENSTDMPMLLTLNGRNIAWVPAGTSKKMEVPMEKTTRWAAYAFRPAQTKRNQVFSQRIPLDARGEGLHVVFTMPPQDEK